MSFPARFLVDIPELEIYRRPMDFLSPALAERMESHRADSPGAGEKSLAALAGLGESSICDFFAPLGARMLVIEQTMLVCWMRDRMGDKSGHEMAEDFAAECLRKMGGSARVLDALFSNFIGGAESPPQADCEFWVAVTDADALVRHAPAYNLLTRRARKIILGQMRRPYVSAQVADKRKFERELTRRLPAE